MHEYWGECSEDWAGACRWGGGVEFLTEKKMSAKKCSWGLKTQKKTNWGGGGGEKPPTQHMFDSVLCMVCFKYNI